MPCISYPDGLTVCFADTSKLLAVEFEETYRWCFGCRKRVRYNWQLKGSKEPSYYEPIWIGDCPNGCGDRRDGGFYYEEWVE